MKKVLQLVSDDFEDLELWCPVMRLREAGAIVDLAAEKPGKYKGKFFDQENCGYLTFPEG